jgi:GNAT superfamily N-acetyltransferase
MSTNAANETTFELLPADHEDIPRLAHIHVVSCLPDNAFSLYFASPQEFERRVIDMLEGQVGDPAWQHIKAVDMKTGILAAWASWNTPSDAQIRERDEKLAARVVTPEKRTGRGHFDFPLGLPIFVEEDTKKWLEKWTRGQRHMLCKGLFTDPSFQRRGMGNALVKHGNWLADQAKLPIFLQASPFGYPIYAKHDFETVQHLDVNLTEWAPDAEGNDKGYGNYRFRYMMRLPRTLSKTL